SEATDPSAFTWSDAGWAGRPWHETVLYEMHLGTFTASGTFLAAIEHLSHLERLGVPTIELMPVGEFPGSRNWGYDGVLPFAPDHSYGRPDDLKRFVDAAHAAGIAVVLDVVYNHFGPDQNTIADYAPEFFTKRHKTPWGGAIDFTQPAVRAYFIQNAVYWIEEFHLDGLRLDAVQAVFDEGSPHILDEIAMRARSSQPGRPLHLTLENDNNDARWLERGADGRALRYDAQWNDDFHHVMRVLLAGRVDGYYRDYATEPLDRLGRALAEGFSYQGDDASIHRPGLRRGTASAHLPPVAFVNFLQNHDQVGNTPFGQRLAALASPAALRLGAAVLLLGPAVPMLFMGEEWAAAEPFDFFCDYPEPLASVVREGRQAEFAHLPEFADAEQIAKLADPNAKGTRDACVLDWQAPGRAPHAGWLEFHTALLATRRERVMPLLPKIGGGAGRYLRVGATALAVHWQLSDGRVLTLAANFGDKPAVWATAGERLFTLGEAGDGLAPWGLQLTLAN
ncbi:MAG: malto-oligosyltrehalose trehalohydrolase, partial [Pseudomonadota bacterium]|nr:malto-oligosyltrehalose trehalohydrolase [Pseudomonadota bacterium]